MIRPEWALCGTVTRSPTLVWRKCDPGEVRLTRAPDERGKTTVIPARRPAPVSFSVPCTETWCGFALQCAAGTQLTEPIRTTGTDVFTGRVGEAPPEAPGADPAACVPPGLLADAAGAAAATASTDATAVAVRGLHRVCAPLLVKT
jgi:hypothetical protein